MKMKKTVKMPLRRPPQRPRPPAAPLRARAAAAEDAYDAEDYESEEPNMKFSHALIVVLVLHLVAVGGVFAFNWIKARQTAEAKTPKQPAAVAETSAEKNAPAAPLDGWKGKTHTVAAGDTLTRIASLHGTTVEALEKENGITTYSMIRVGQVLKIPGEAKASSAKKTETAKSSPAPSDAAARQAFLAAKSDMTPVKATVISAVPAGQVPKAAETSKPAPAAEDGVYVVAKGDNPYTIAKKLHVSYNELIKVNNIEDPTKIQIGQKLKIPNKN